MVEIFERSKFARALDITDTQIGSHYSPSSFPYSSALQPIFFLNLLSFLFLPSNSVSTANLWRPSKQHPPTYLWASHRPPSSDYFSCGYDNHSSFLSGQPTVVSSLVQILTIPCRVTVHHMNLHIISNSPTPYACVDPNIFRSISTFTYGMQINATLQLHMRAL